MTSMAPTEARCLAAARACPWPRSESGGSKRVPEKRFSMVCGVSPWRSRRRVVTCPEVGGPADDLRWRAGLQRHLLGQRLRGDDPDLAGLLRRDHRIGHPVEGAVGEAVGVRVLRTRNPGPADLGLRRDQAARLVRQRLEVGVLDLPAAGHLLDDELGVHPDLDLRARVQAEGSLQGGDQARVLGDVVRGDPQRGGAFGQHLTGVGVAHHGPVGRRARVAARGTVGLDHQSATHGAQSPESDTRMRIRRQSSQRTTASSASSRIRFRSVVDSSMWQPSQRPRRSAAAPTPSAPARIFS